MSSKPEAQNEPTMEEILASIRRIISEDEPAAGKPAEAVPPATPPAAPKAAAKPAPEPAGEPAGRGADNILELTRMVADDGSIVDLTEQPAGDEDAVAEDAVAEDAVEEPSEAADDAAAAEADAEAPAAEEPDSAEEPAAEAEAEEQPAPEEEPAAEEEPSPEEETGDEEPSGGDLLRPMGEPEAEDQDDEPAAEPAAGVPAQAGEGTEFVSAVTATAATASLAAVTKAAMANRQGNAIAIGGGRTLEELVRESLAPELKGWLDANLPDLVERIVREEIRKMIRRAEDQ